MILLELLYQYKIQTFATKICYAAQTQNLIYRERAGWGGDKQQQELYRISELETETGFRKIFSLAEMVRQNPQNFENSWKSIEMKSRTYRMIFPSRLLSIETYVALNYTHKYWTEIFTNSLINNIMQDFGLQQWV